MRIKGFDKNLQCRGMQFEVGKEYKIELGERNMELCSDTVFHYCDSLQKVHNHYSCSDETNRFCEIEVLGEEITDGEKCGSNHIKIVREIADEELKQLKGLINGNTGLFNSGYLNSGAFNSCHGSNGVFCNESDMDICIFNMPSGMSLKEFYNSRYWNAICSSDFNLTEWVEYTKEEKEADKDKALIGGYLKTNSYKDTCKKWWNEMSESNKEIIKSIPNFNAKIFKDITGIEV